MGGGNGARMLIDAFTFFNECDLLEIRLAELYDVVDRFVIVEATRTHKGDPKPLYYINNQARFRPWEDKIAYICVDDMPEGETLAAIRRREMFQRNCILRGLRDAKDDDVVLISDCDEIPRRSLMPAALPDGAILVYLQRLHYYNLNTYAPDRPWPGTRACRVADARAMSPHIVRNGIGQSDAHYPQFAAIPNAGWHYSYLGDAEHIRTKQTQFLHQELVTAENTDLDAIRARVAAGEDVWGRTNEQRFEIGPAVDVPWAVAADPARWAHLFAPGWRGEA